MPKITGKKRNYCASTAMEVLNYIFFFKFLTRNMSTFRCNSKAHTHTALSFSRGKHRKISKELYVYDLALESFSYADI